MLGATKQQSLSNWKCTQGTRESRDSEGEKLGGCGKEEMEEKEKKYRWEKNLKEETDENWSKID